MTNAIKSELVEKLKQEHCFWSFNNDSIEISDEILIEKTLLHLDLAEIDKLFQIYPLKKIKRVWLDNLIPQGEYIYSLNRFIAWYYFNSKSPDSYIKAMETRYYNKFIS